jgi:type IV pilus assembly protein PilO
VKFTRANLLSLLNLHIAGAALLLLLNLVLAVRLFIAWNTVRSASPDQLQQKQITYRGLQLEMSPLHGLPQKVDLSRTKANEFYADRFPAAYSTISATVNDLAVKNSVRLTNLAYTPTPALPGLAEVRMDASLSGEYSSLMHVINGMERSKTFFLIYGLTLTGQQGGLVNLRLRLITYMHYGPDQKLIAPPAEGVAVAAGEEDR